jgi:hypothetical protein
MPSAGARKRIEEAFRWIGTITGQESPASVAVIASHGLLPSLPREAFAGRLRIEARNLALKRRYYF